MPFGTRRFNSNLKYAYVLHRSKDGFKGNADGEKFNCALNKCNKKTSELRLDIKTGSSESLSFHHRPHQPFSSTFVFGTKSPTLSTISTIRSSSESSYFHSQSGSSYSVLPTSWIYSLHFLPYTTDTAAAASPAMSFR